MFCFICCIVVNDQLYWWIYGVNYQYSSGLCIWRWSNRMVSGGDVTLTNMGIYRYPSHDKAMQSARRVYNSSKTLKISTNMVAFCIWHMLVEDIMQKIMILSQKESQKFYSTTSIIIINTQKSISFTVKYLYSIQYTWLSTEQFIIMPYSSNSNCDVWYKRLYHSLTGRQFLIMLVMFRELGNGSLLYAIENHCQTNDASDILNDHRVTM